MRAQSVAAGIVERPRGRDTVIADGIRVLLHRVGRESQGPIDSTLADRGGRFRLRFRPDTTALYLLSARYGGIEYFSSPIHTKPALPDTAIRLMVYDTSAAAPVSIAARHIVVPRPGQDGARTVLDLLVLRNDGSLARVAGDPAGPSWSTALPAGAAGFELGESDLSPDAVTRRGDSVFILSPIAPGDKQITLEYVIPADRPVVDFPSGSGGPINVLIEEKAAKVVGGTLALADSQLIEGRWFYRWSGRVGPNATIHLTLPRIGRTPRLLLAGLVGSLGLVLAFVAWRAASRTASAEPTPPADGLLDSLASLDARYVGREAEVGADEWETYRRERSRLKADLEAALAGGNSVR